MLEFLKLNKDKNKSDYIKNQIKLVEKRNNKKIFVIGFNKTGTTSIDKSLEDFGFIRGKQWRFTVLFDNYLQGKCNMEEIFELIKSAEYFQDNPFSFPGFWREVYSRYPEAYYILPVRDSPTQWFNSMYSFHVKVFGNGESISEDDLKKAYNGSGMAFRFNKHKFNGCPFYDADSYQAVYEKHNNDVRSFFNGKENFIEINVAVKDSYLKMCDFLNVKPLRDSFMWLNKT
jgi:hypothetical protein